MSKDQKPFILGVNGSPHKDGLCSDLLQKMLYGAEAEGAETKTIHLYDFKISLEPGLYSEAPEKETAANMPKDDMTKLYPDITRADGLILATPVYWANMSGAMKDFIDRLTPLENEGFQLEGKLAAFIAASKEYEGGAEMAAMSMVTALAQMGVFIPPYAILWGPSGSSTARRKGVSWAEEDAPHIGKTMTKLISLFKEKNIEWY